MAKAIPSDNNLIILLIKNTCVEIGVGVFYLYFTDNDNKSSQKPSFNIEIFKIYKKINSKTVYIFHTGTY